MSDSLSLAELAEGVNAWCDEHGIAPASGQAGATVTERNIRFYRTLGLVDGPAGPVKGYGEKHLLQLVAMRLLQARGLPLRQIRELLYGRSLAELREIRRRGLREVPRADNALHGLIPGVEELWRIIPLNDDFILCSRRGATLTPAQRAEVLRALGEKVSVVEP